MNIRETLKKARAGISEGVKRATAKPPPPPKRDFGLINARRRKTRDAYIDQLNKRMNKRSF